LLMLNPPYEWIRKEKIRQGQWTLPYFSVACKARLTP
jgi:hypothetical protein